MWRKTATNKSPLFESLNLKAFGVAHPPLFQSHDTRPVFWVFFVIQPSIFSLFFAEMHNAWFYIMSWITSTLPFKFFLLLDLFVCIFWVFTFLNPYSSLHFWIPLFPSPYFLKSRIITQFPTQYPSHFPLFVWGFFGRGGAETGNPSPVQPYTKWPQRMMSNRDCARWSSTCNRK